MLEAGALLSINLVSQVRFLIEESLRKVKIRKVRMHGEPTNMSTHTHIVALRQHAGDRGYCIRSFREGQ